MGFPLFFSKKKFVAENVYVALPLKLTEIFN
jgi:hypothetical protein